MKKLDRRVLRTRRALAEALITLALKHGYEGLTVTAVTEQAGIGYRTFTRHYRSLDELLAETLLTAFRELVMRVAQADTPFAESVAACAFIRERPDVLRVYVNLPSKHPARQAVLAEASKVMRSCYIQQDTSSAPMDLAIDQLLHAINNLTVWYLDHLDDYTIEQAAAIYDDLVVKALEHQALVRRGERNDELAGL